MWVLLGSSWGPPGDLLGTSWGPPGVLLGTSWGPPGVWVNRHLNSFLHLLIGPFVIPKLT